MVVGVGGMGTNTVRAVKRRFRNVWGGDQLPGMIQLLALDTEPLVNRLDQEPLFADEFAYMGKFDATRLVANLDQHPEIERWWNYPSIPLGYIHNGAKQLRPIGRLCFFRNYVTFKQLLETKLTNLDKIRDMEAAQNRGFPVVGNYQLIYVVGSLCGGTGSGMFMDTVHSIRARVRNNARIVGIFYLPDVLENEISSDLQRRRIRANAYAALKELNYFQETQQFRELYPSEQRELPDTPYTPFDFIFLVGRTNRDGRSLARKADAEQMAAHLIQLTAISHLSSEILGLEVNVVRERMYDLSGAAGEVTGFHPTPFDRPDELRRDARGHFLVYSGFATSALVAPREALVDFWQRAFVSDLVRRFASGPSLSDPRTELAVGDRQRLMTLWQGLLAQLVTRYAALDNERLEALQAEIEEQRGAWFGFWEPVPGCGALSPGRDGYPQRTGAL
ncbi:MAG: tubulin-like doman-containing protein [Caldilineaceae bacterium]